MNLTPEDRQVGRDNFEGAVGVKRREFLRSLIGAGVVSGAGLGAAYFNYSKKLEDPVRVGVIGTGDEGNVLIGGCTPDYVRVVAIADIRPFNIHRAFFGDWGSDRAHEARPGLIQQYGWTETEARQNVTVYDAKNGGYQALLKDPAVEAVIIALPLHLHAQAAIDAMLAGKHVLTEKLMGHNVAQCKIMARVAAEQKKLLATGHQRHYSVLYDNAVHMIRWGLLGELHHIRAQWHRGNLPGKDSWAQPLPGGETGPDGKVFDAIADRLKALQGSLPKQKDPKRIALLEAQIAQWAAWDSDQTVNAKDFGYEDRTLGGRQRSALEELCRWRLWERTGGGLMAELGSHQLDAASIFISALRADGKKAHPLSVHATGGRHLFPLDRDAEDHVYCTFEFPGPGYEPKFDYGYRDKAHAYPPASGIPPYSEDPNKRITVTYSSINGNGFGGYGEIVMGTKGTLVLEQEQEVMLYAGSSTSSRVSVKEGASGPSMDTQSSGDMPGAVAKAANSGPVSRGYTEEIEHWAHCIRANDPEELPRCRPEVALGDAVIALAANVAIKNSQAGRGGYLEFKESWFDVDNDEVPTEIVDGKPKIDIKTEMQRLMKQTASSPPPTT